MYQRRCTDGPMNGAHLGDSPTGMHDPRQPASPDHVRSLPGTPGPATLPSLGLRAIRPHR